MLQYVYKNFGGSLIKYDYNDFGLLHLNARYYFALVCFKMAFGGSLLQLTEMDFGGSLVKCTFKWNLEGHCFR